MAEQSQVSGTFDAAKPTLLALQGGPGGLCDSMAQNTRLQTELGRIYNLVFFDPRGTGRSKKASTNSLTDMSRYGTQEDLSDIALVAKAFAPDRTIFLLGHSYGACLALAYAATHPGIPAAHYRQRLRR
jgi:pimeloyl-ACP methyl ester carboxylesterase